MAALPSAGRSQPCPCQHGSCGPCQGSGLGAICARIVASCWLCPPVCSFQRMLELHVKELCLWHFSLLLAGEGWERERRWLSAKTKQHPKRAPAGGPEGHVKHLWIHTALDGAAFFYAAFVFSFQ